MSSLFARLSRSLGPNQAAQELRWLRNAAGNQHDLEHMVSRRAQGEPLQYIIGTQPFGPLEIQTRPPVLIPRPETEQWTSKLAERISSIPRAPSLKVLDICTGTACIPLLLCNLLNTNGTQVAGLGIDISTDACRLARNNIASISVSPASSLAVQQMDLFNNEFWKMVENAFRMPPLQRVVDQQQIFPLDVITANPPYIPLAQWQQLPPEVRDWEDPAALIGDAKGLTFYRRIRDLVSSGDILSSNGLLAMEVGDGQARDVAKLFKSVLGDVEVWKDLWGKERAVIVHGVR
ncbi:hypothetical protein M422DRAFT_59338 [Sphaerobolus stellatus SS14]|nr:hypothetical protein M422DRAFT_59338 [Sphaerobolus stellatus SS14]